MSGGGGGGGGAGEAEHGNLQTTRTKQKTRNNDEITWNSDTFALKGPSSGSKQAPEERVFQQKLQHSTG